jgi:hypothetical protein
MKLESSYNGIEAEVAVFYGLTDRLTTIFQDYSIAAKAAYIDLGYWGRREGGRWNGYHKVCINSRHPTEYFQLRKHSPNRAERFGINIEPWRVGRYWKEDKKYILLCGMGDKGAQAEGYRAEQWERWAIEEIRSRTNRPIVYRPKPSWKCARRIQGVGFSHKDVSIEEALVNCHAVVTHHSNAAVDAMVRGIPAFVWKGVGVVIGSSNLDDIDTPRYPEGREQWVNDIAHTQWSVDEMRAGIAWRDLSEEGLV